jgi:hypothetical protein
VSDDLRDFLRRMADEGAPSRREPPAPMLRRVARRRTRSATVLGLVVVLVGYGAFAGVRAANRPTRVPVASAPPACSTWAVVPSPNLDPDRLESDLRAVVTFSDTDAWAVGEAGVNQEGGEQNPLAMHWDGTSWSIVDIPGSYGHQGLLAVGGSGPHDVWAMGLGHQALHWDGSSWSLVPLADPGSAFWHVEAISAVATDDAWAVGNMTNGTGTSGAPLAEHWDGSSWSIADTPDPIPQPKTAEAYGTLSAVDAITGDDVWATGQTENVAPVGQSNTVALHWDGSSWTRTQTPDVEAQSGTYGHLLGVSAGGSSDVWAVGIAGDAPGTMGGGDRALIEHWNGSAWSVKDTLPADSRLLGVAAPAPDDAWAVGSTSVPGSYRPLILQWDGIAWTEVSTPVAGSAGLNSIAASPDGSLWAVGSQQVDGHGRTLTLHCVPG